MLTLEILVCSFTLIIIIGILWKYMVRIQGSEGFNGSLQSRYTALKSRIPSVLANYCKLTDFAQKQMTTMYTSASKGSESDAAAYIQQMYTSVYACTDELASSRACQVVTGNFIPCSTYTNLPDWSGSDSDKDSVAVALTQIPDNLAARIMAESAYYKTIIQKLQAGINAAKNPPSAAPDSPSSPAASPSGKPWTVEGFDGNTCSPAAAQARLEFLRKQNLSKESEGCTIPSLDAEIARVSAILASDMMNAALAGSNGILGQMIQLQADIEAVKRQWGDDGPKKSYTQFKGGDRSMAFLFSLQQNR